MGEIIRAHQWSSSPLGEPSLWPDRLLSPVEVVLSSKFPMFLIWGPDRTFIYNDAYIPVLGQKHPWALGRGFFEIWPEVQEQVEPIIDQAYAGQSSYFEDLPVVLHRSSLPEQTYFTFSYNPVRDRDGHVAGALCILQETTSKVLSEQRLGFLVQLTDRLRGLMDPLEVVCAAAEMLGGHLGVSRVGYGDVDETARYFTTPRNWTDGSVQHHAGTHDLAAFGPEIHAALQQGEPLVVHDVATDPRTSSPSSQAAFAYLETAAAATVSLIKQERMVAALYVHHRLPRRWTAADIQLIQDVAERTWDAVERARSEKTLRDREARLRLAIDVGRMAVWEMDPATDRLKHSPQLNRLFGLPPEAVPTGEELRARYAPGERERLRQQMQFALTHGEHYTEAEHHVIWPDGSSRWLLLRAEILRDGAGALSTIIGVAIDITERKRSEQHQQLLINELNHRVKNTLATVQSIASQTLRNSDNPDEARSAIETRLFALSRAHDVLTRENWEGAGLKEIVTQAMAPYRHEQEDRLHIAGPEVRLSPSMALAFAMALHELATNAVKYGALSDASGEIRVAWRLNKRDEAIHLHLTWTESGGPPVAPPTRRGFGTRLIERSLAQDLQGEVRIAFEPTGLVCTVDAPVQKS
jgi:PAS domain S-box-containing protein